MAAEAVTQIMTARVVEEIQESPFYIPMTGPAARPRRSLKHDDTFIVLDSHGDIGASAGGPDGLFNADTRYLARLELVLDELQPLLLGSNLRDDNSGLAQVADGIATLVNWLDDVAVPVRNTVRKSLCLHQTADLSH